MVRQESHQDNTSPKKKGKKIYNVKCKFDSFSRKGWGYIKDQPEGEILQIIIYRKYLVDCSRKEIKKIVLRQVPKADFVFIPKKKLRYQVFDLNRGKISVNFWKLFSCHVL